ncbi:MAG: response regulator [Candidatus Woesearchaeota archaeon]
MKKILIVEDSSLMVAVIRNFIKKEGKEVEILEAHTGEEGVQKYNENKPDLVFMDIKMPGMDGITALETIKKSNPGAKVVMCTSLKEPEQEEKAKAAGCVAYIMKPFNRQDIVDAMNNFL